MKIIFFGSGNYVSPIIEVIKKNFDLVEIVTPKARISKEADLGVVASYGKIITKDILESFPYGIINVHPSLLPKYRGSSPVQTTILNGDKKTGITIIKIDEKVDHGSILAQKEIQIDENETSEALLEKLFGLGAEILPSIISKYIEGQIELSPQDDSRASYTELLTKKSGYLDLESLKISKAFFFTEGEQIGNLKLKISRMIRAYYPWPGVWFKTKLGGKEQIIKLLPGQKIQVEGKNPMNFKDFMNGYSEGGNILSKLNLRS